jgi:hypothetical protein
MRADLYSTVHKALRARLFDLALELGRSDFANPGDVRIVLEAYRRTVAFLREHHQHEETFCEPALAAVEPELVAANARQHAAIDAALAEMDDLAGALETTHGDDRAAVGRLLETRLTRFVSDYLAHMSHEETVLQPAFWAHLTDEEIGAMRGRIQGSMPPGRFAEWLEIMLPAINLDERAGMLGGMKRGAPREVLEVAAAVGERVLGGSAWQAVRSRAELG